MDIVLSLVTTPEDSRLGGGDSFTDRLSSKHTVFLLVVMATVITTLQWVWNIPISCYCPAHFTSSQIEYANKVCWTHNTYYLPITQERIPKSPKLKAYISYYQWVGLALLFQAVFFYLPRLIWIVINKKAGISVNTVTDTCVQLQGTLNQERRDQMRNFVVNHMGKFLMELSRYEALSGPFKSICVSLYGNYLIIAYTIVKLIYIGNVVGQVFLLNHFLGMDFHMYGFEVVKRLYSGESWIASERFPRITLCDLNIRRLGNIQNYTIQCSLPYNLFNEIVYVVVWFWMVFVAIATVCSLIQWLIVFGFLSQQVHAVRRKLIAMNVDDDTEVIVKFVTKFLRRDGLFLIRMASKNTSGLLASTILTDLYKFYCSNKDIPLKVRRREFHRQMSHYDAATDTSPDAFMRPNIKQVLRAGSVVGDNTKMLDCIIEESNKVDRRIAEAKEDSEQNCTEEPVINNNIGSTRSDTPV